MAENLGLTKTLQEMEEQIRSSNSTGAPQESAPEPQEKKQKTKAEIEAYRQKKMEEEEKRYLKSMPAKRQKAKKRRKTAEGKGGASPQKSEKAPKRTKGTAQKDTAQKRGKPVPQAKKQVAACTFNGMVPLHMLHIPGLPKGKFLLVSLVTPEQ